MKVSQIKVGQIIKHNGKVYIKTNFFTYDKFLYSYDKEHIENTKNSTDNELYHTFISETGVISSMPQNREVELIQ